MKPIYSIVLASVLLTLASIPVAAESTTLMTASDSASGLDKSLELEIHAAIDRALNWLAAQQKPNGSWSNESFPALSAMQTWAFARSSHEKRATALPKAVAFLKSCVQEDGGIYKEVPGRKGGGLANYNTAICMTALHEVKDPALTRIIQNARTFVANGQATGDDIYDGGFGYDRKTNRPYADLMNTVYAAEAMRLTQDVEDLRPAGEKKVGVDWEAATAFIDSLQNKSESGEEDAGGFFYKPGESKAGTTTNASGVVVFRSYGSMTYAGMLGLIYANVDRDDPRIRSAFDWAVKHWSLEENPGMGPQGLFFFYNILTRSLSAYGAEVLQVSENEQINWRKEVARKLLSLQTIDPATGQGYWLNNEGRFWERDPVLVTGYSVLALQHLIGQ